MEKSLKEASEYVRNWKSYQSLWDIES